MNRIAQYILPSWRLFLHLAWAVWWGGIFFYATVVVPIGTEAIGSSEQGFITQKVSQVHNVVAITFLVCLAVETARARSRLVGILTAILAINVLFLVRWHSHLTGLLNVRDQSISSGFYQQHAVYLWLIAFEWLLGIITPLVLFVHRAEMESGKHKGRGVATETE